MTNTPIRAVRTAREEQGGVMAGQTITEKVQQAAAALSGRDGAYEDAYAAAQAERAAEEHRRRDAAARVRDTHEQQQLAAAEALRIGNDQLRRVGRAATIAAQRIDEFRAENQVHRDVAGGRFDQAAMDLRATLDAELARLRQRLCSPSRLPVGDAIGRIGALRITIEDLDAVRELILGGEVWSPLSAEEIAARVAAAREHQREIAASITAARDAVQELGRITRWLDIGHGQAPDPEPHAAAAIDANNTAQAALRALIAALEPTTTTTEDHR